MERERIMSLPIYLKKDDVDKLLSAQLRGYGAKHERNQLLARLMLTTGMRVGEVCKLQVEHIDFEERMIFIRKGKGGKDRIVFLEPETASRLRKFVRERTYGPVFEAKPRCFQRIIKKMARIANVRNAGLVTPHKLRHTFAINWIQRNGDVESLRRLLGHNSLATTQVYLNFDFDYLRSQFDRLMSGSNQERRMI